MEGCIRWTDLGATKLFTDFLYHFERVQDLFPAPPFETRRWKNVFEKRIDDFSKRRNDTLSSYLTPWCREHGHRSDDFDLLWVTGQQPGILGGPLFTLYKIVTAERLARETDGDGIRFHAAFWSLAEDHDLVEALTIATPEEEALAWTPIPAGLRSNRRPLYRVAVSEEAIQVAVRFHGERYLHGLYRDEMEASVKRCYSLDGATTLPDAFRCYLHLFGVCDSLLHYVSADNAVVKQQALELIQAVVERWPELYEGWMAHNEALSKRGYHLQVQPYARYFPMFRLTPEGRHRIQWVDGRLVVPGTGESWTPDAFLQWVSSHAAEISPNVILRPLIQDVVLPTAGYVAGPAEIAYFAQLSYFYRALTIPMPIIFPRMSVTVISPSIKRTLRKLQVTAEDVLRRGDEVVVEAVTGLEEWRQRIRTITASVQALEQERTQLLGPAGNDHRVERILDALKRRLMELEEAGARACQRVARVEDRRWCRLLNWLRPAGQLQERVFHPGVIYGQVGPEFRAALNRVAIFVGEHQMVEIA